MSERVVFSSSPSFVVCMCLLNLSKLYAFLVMNLFYCLMASLLMGRWTHSELFSLVI